MKIRTKKLTTMLGAVLALAVLATACGGGDASADDQEVIDAVAASIREEGDVPVGVDVECMAGAMVTTLGGAAGMEADYGLTAANLNDSDVIDDLELPKDKAISMADGMMGCGMTSVMVDEIAGDGMPQEDAECLVEKMDQDALRDTFAAEFMNDAEGDALGEAAEQAMFSSMFTAIGECDIDPNDLGL